MPQHKLSLCRDCYPSWFLKQVKNTILKYKMFDKDERILVAVSGGKDSLSLWDALVKLGYNADGVHIYLGIKEYSDISLELSKKMSERLNKMLHIVDINELSNPISKIAKKNRRPVCSICGFVRRYILNKIALEKGYTCVATGHNLDDETAILLSNVLRWNVELLARQKPVLQKDDKLVKKVKPLCRLTEKEIKTYASISGFDFVEQKCPYSTNSTVNFLKEILNRIEEKSPGTKIQFYQKFVKVADVFKIKEEKLNYCQICGQPTTANICTFCRLLKS